MKWTLASIFVERPLWSWTCKSVCSALQVCVVLNSQYAEDTALACLLIFSLGNAAMFNFCYAYCILAKIMMRKRDVVLQDLFTLLSAVKLCSILNFVYSVLDPMAPDLSLNDLVHGLGDRVHCMGLHYYWYLDDLLVLVSSSEGLQGILKFWIWAVPWMWK